MDAEELDMLVLGEEGDMHWRLEMARRGFALSVAMRELDPAGQSAMTSGSHAENGQPIQDGMRPGTAGASPARSVD